MIKHKISVHNVFIAIAAWLAAWIATQGLFISEVLTYLPWDINISYSIGTIWVFTVVFITLITMPKYRKNSLPRSKLLWLYAFPMIALVLLPLHYALALDVRVYIPMIIITVFWQDYLTFGILQPALAQRLSPNKAAVTTAIVFVFGHVMFSLNNVLDPQLLLVTVAGFVFALSTKSAKNIYIANVVHVSFYLV